MAKPFFIVGPTAVGKSRLAIEVALRLGGEIINADAFQVYSGLDLLTAKPTPDDCQRIPHHLLGTVPLVQAYNVARYLDDASACLRSLAQRNNPAIVVGGSGLYVKALTHGLSPLPGAHPEIRAELEQLDCASLLDRLRGLDVPAAAVIDGQNKRRLVRAIEVCLVTGKKFSDFRDLWSADAGQNPIRGVYLWREKSDLHARIEHRTRQMFAEGVIDEVRAVPLEMLSDTSVQTIGYAEIRSLLDGQIGLQACQDKIVHATRRYAKRQNTWFRAATYFDRMDLSSMVRREDLVEQIVRHFQRSEDQLHR